MGTSGAAEAANARVSAQKTRMMASVLGRFIGHGAGELEGAHQQVAFAANRVGRLRAEAAGLDPVRSLDRQRPLFERVHRAARVAARTAWPGRMRWRPNTNSRSGEALGARLKLRRMPGGLSRDSPSQWVPLFG